MDASLPEWVAGYWRALPEARTEHEPRDPSSDDQRTRRLVHRRPFCSVASPYTVVTCPGAGCPMHLETAASDAPARMLFALGTLYDDHTLHRKRRCCTLGGSRVARVTAPADVSST